MAYRIFDFDKNNLYIVGKHYYDIGMQFFDMAASQAEIAYNTHSEKDEWKISHFKSCGEICLLVYYDLMEDHFSE